MAYGTQKFDAAFTFLTLNQMNPIPRVDNYFFKIHSNIVLPSALGLPRGLFSVGLPIKMLKTLLTSSILAT